MARSPRALAPRARGLGRSFVKTLVSKTMPLLRFYNWNRGVVCPELGEGFPCSSRLRLQSEDQQETIGRKGPKDWLEGISWKKWPETWR